MALRARFLSTLARSAITSFPCNLWLNLLLCVICVILAFLLYLAFAAHQHEYKPVAHRLPPTGPGVNARYVAPVRLWSTAALWSLHLCVASLLSCLLMTDHPVG